MGAWLSISMSSGSILSFASLWIYIRASMATSSWSGLGHSGYACRILWLPMTFKKLAELVLILKRAERFLLSWYLINVHKPLALLGIDSDSDDSDPDLTSSILGGGIVNSIQCLDFLNW